jgi:hypothetical protein
MDARAADRHAFRDEQCAFERFIAAVTAKPAAGSDDAVTWHIGAAAFTHDVADGARGARAASQRGHIPVGCDASRRYAADDGEHAGSEVAGHG